MPKDDPESHESHEAEGPSIAHGQSDAPAMVDATHPDEPALVWCRKCKAEVRPQGKGLCSRCGSFLKLNFVARRHPVNVLRRDALLSEIVAQFPPDNVIDRSTCEQLAATLEQLETIRPGTTEWQRLSTAAQTLGGALHEAKAKHRASLPASDQITRVESVIVDSLDRVAGPPRESSTLREAHASTVLAPGCCRYCGQTPCVGADHPHFRLLHHNDPQEIARRDREATEIMMHQVGRPLPGWYR